MGRPPARSRLSTVPAFGDMGTVWRRPIGRISDSGIRSNRKTATLGAFYRNISVSERDQRRKGNTTVDQSSVERRSGHIGRKARQEGDEGDEGESLGFLHGWLPADRIRRSLWTFAWQAVNRSDRSERLERTASASFVVSDLQRQATREREQRRGERHLVRSEKWGHRPPVRGERHFVRGGQAEGLSLG